MIGSPLVGKHEVSADLARRDARAVDHERRGARTHVEIALDPGVVDCHRDAVASAREEHWGKGEARDVGSR